MNNPANKDLFFSKNDPTDPRLGGLVKHNISIDQNSFVVLGHPDDTGIKLNGGRVGAALAPDRIRNFLYRMTPSLSGEAITLTDVGDVTGHDEAFLETKKYLAQGANVIAVGGGHDYGFPNFAAFTEVMLAEGKKPLIINFDAHLDVRPNNISNNSGTPFYRLLEKYSKDITFFEVGIQDWCNSKTHLEWAKDHGAQVITRDEIESSGKSLSHLLSAAILPGLNKNTQVALSLDIDCFASGAAPGASQVFPVGIDAAQLLDFWKRINAQAKSRLMGVYEVSPPLDLDDRTSRLASLFIHQFLYR